MGFLDASLTTAASLSKTATTTPTAAASVTTLPATTASVATSITTTLTGATNGVAQIGALTNGLSKVGTSLETSLIAAGTSMLNSALKSITATFTGSKTALASAISPALSGLFTNTNNPAASTIVTAISDPVKTNLINAKTPVSNGFKVTSAQAGSEILSVSGATSTTGTGALAMTGTALSTVINRFNLDSVTQLPGAASNSLLTSKLNGLFSTLAVDAGSLVSSVVGTSALGKVVASSTTALVAASLGVSRINNPAADLGQYNASTSALASLLGTKDVSAFYLTNPTTSLVDNTGAVVATNGSGVDAATANAILGLVKAAGCAVANGLQYSSANNQASLFNLGLNLAAANGMSSLVSSLLGCSQAGTTLGQQSLTTAFTTTAGTQPAIAASILGSITNKAALNTDFIGKSIVTNPNLSAKDLGTVNGLFASLDSSTLGAMTIPTPTSFPVPVYDFNTLSAASPSFVDSAFGDTTMTDYLAGYEMKLQNDGSLAYV